jgi:CheY-like chemotaxis protein
MNEPKFTKEPVIILIADDEEPIAQVIGLIVEDAGYHALLAHHGKEALHYYHQQRPALVITDLMMPQMGGQEFIATLHAEHAGHVPPIIVMTAATAPALESIGADEILYKPFEVETVERLLKQFLSSDQATERQ